MMFYALVVDNRHGCDPCFMCWDLGSGFVHLFEGSVSKDV